jgi:hypothetical protein
MPSKDIYEPERCIMSITYLDADTREVVDIVELQASAIYAVKAKKFAAKLGATIVRTVPTHTENEWTIELKIPLTVRRKHTLLPSDQVRFRARIGLREHKVLGAHYFRRNQSYVIFDDGGGEWEVQSMWQIKKL